jgi:hypothetical protein
MATFRSTPTVPPEVITYRLGEKLVYVKPAADYEARYTQYSKYFLMLKHLLSFPARA